MTHKARPSCTPTTWWSLCSSRISNLMYENVWKRRRRNVSEDDKMSRKKKYLEMVSWDCFPSNTSGLRFLVKLVWVHCSCNLKVNFMEQVLIYFRQYAYGTVIFALFVLANIVCHLHMEGCLQQISSFFCPMLSRCAQANLKPDVINLPASLSSSCISSIHLFT